MDDVSPSETPPHIARMIEENDQLTERLDKLGAFLGGEVFKALPDIDQELLRAQLAAMFTYGTVLAARIARGTLMTEGIEPGEGMRRYIGTKAVNAKPMTRLDYNELRGWRLPDDEDGSDAGYLVEYADGQRPNVKGFKGYVSWSPADVFEGSYR